MNRLGVKRLIVFVYTHCNPENGDLHCKHGAGLKVDDVGTTSTVQVCILDLTYFQFFNAILTPDLGNYASQCHSIMFLEVCGGIWSCESARESVFQYARS